MLSVTKLRREFHLRHGWFDRRVLVAVDDVSFAVPRGKTIAIVGESGSGKTTLGRCIVGLLPPTAGTIEIDQINPSTLPAAQAKAFRRHIQMVFQDPDESLNPRMSIADTLHEPLRRWHRLRGDALQRRTAELLDQVQLSPRLLGYHPHHLSGGQQQRVGIARALAAQPDVIVLDEPTSALDVSVQAQILNLLVDLQQQHQMTYLLISHDLATVRYLAQEVIVLYLGRVVEQGPVDVLFDDPQHPYTRALLTSAPRLHALPRADRLTLRGEVGNPGDIGRGCALSPRCPLAEAHCADTPQILTPVGTNHTVACQVVTRT
jgi:peptide/nickel transport system ATP-binding protein